MIRTILITLLMLVSVAGVTALGAGTETAHAQFGAMYEVDIGNLPNKGANRANDTRIQAALTVIFGIVGVVALLMITIGGFRYIAAQGDAKQAADAKGTIINALIGLIVAILGITIVTFVVGRLT